jgi:hypothetical protein
MEDRAARLLLENRIMDGMKILNTGPHCTIPDQVACVLMTYLLGHCYWYQTFPGQLSARRGRDAPAWPGGETPRNGTCDVRPVPGQ